MAVAMVNFREVYTLVQQGLTLANSFDNRGLLLFVGVDLRAFFLPFLHPTAVIFPGRERGGSFRSFGFSWHLGHNILN